MKYYKNYLILFGVIFVIILTFISYLYYDFEDHGKQETQNEITTSKSLESFYVDVKGAVKKPGVYEFSQGDRVILAIEKAGGLTKSANTSNINLSQKLESEMVVYVYTNTEIKNGSKSINCETKCECNSIEVNNCYVDKETSAKVNINTANLDTLLTLSGIGESKAEAIISYRDKNGDFNSIEDLMNVSGIGDSVFNSIKDKITV